MAIPLKDVHDVVMPYALEAWRQMLSKICEKCGSMEPFTQVDVAIEGTLSVRGSDIGHVIRCVDTAACERRRRWYRRGRYGSA